MRILHVISSIDRKHGGPTAALLGLTSAQVRRGLDVTVVSTFRANEEVGLADSLRECGVRIHLFGPGSGRFIRVKGLGRHINELVAGSDVVHIHALWEDVQHLAAVAARDEGVPYIIRPCGMLDPWSLSQSKWAKKLIMFLRIRKDLNGAAAIHFTAELERTLAGFVGVNGPQEIVEPNGIDFSEFDSLPERGAFCRSHPETAARPIVLFLSRIHPKKGLDLLIPAFARGAPADARLVLAGPGEDSYMAELKALARVHGIAERITWTGMLRGRQRVEAYVDADLFVLPSHQENFGIVVVEALAAGCPVVISDQVNIWPEIERAGVGGVVPLDVDQLAGKIRVWMTDSTLRKAAKARAAPFVRDRYDWNEIGSHWVVQYQRLVAGGKALRAIA